MVTFRRARRVRFHLIDGTTLEGVVTARTRHDWVLTAGKLVQAEDQTIPLDGNIELERRQVRFRQVLS